MKQLSEYITEKANFLVKKHMTGNKILFGDFFQWFCEQRSSSLRGRNIFELSKKDFYNLMIECGRNNQYSAQVGLWKSKADYRNWIVENKETEVEEFKEETLETTDTMKYRYRYSMRVDDKLQIFRTENRYKK